MGQLNKVQPVYDMNVMERRDLTFLTTFAE